ncbi:circularly permuted type 2 ATP-grasp protein [Rubrobacter indicoceani]|uniref:circularly permuted type 2 ATP-grasp protein n=1 Tax=Rubrobacter indicoceani TaxID=2051957 RepID=UPI000E5C4BC5|nr:circularly permuted type 2 ATP-grasp protein [Rubrobacter indicoceani]
MQTEVSSLDVYNEARTESGEVRSAYQPLLEAFEVMGPSLRSERRRKAARRLRELGATFDLPDGDGGGSRILPADWTPRIVPREHWEALSNGLLQRGRAINAWLSDLYDGDPGEQSVVPEEVVRSSALYSPRAFPGSETTYPVHVYGPDVVHLGDGDYVVLEDNVRVPSGAAYADSIRRVGREVYRDVYEAYPSEVGEISGYYGMLRATLEAAAPPDVTEPHLALLTGGRGDSAYFEHRHLAGVCDLELLTPEDLDVKTEKVVSRNTGRRIDVIYRRADDGGVISDINGLGRVCRENHVAIVNAPGVGIADDKAVFPYVPEMIRTYLKEDPLLSSATTLPLADPDRRGEALDRLPELVLKPREGYGGLGVVIGPEADEATLAEARRNVSGNPDAFIAQECLNFSTHVTDPHASGEADSKPNECFIDLRAFVLPVVGYAMPGGLTRVAKPGTRVVNSSSGGGFKDTWVLQG